MRVATDAEGRIRPDAFAAALDRCTTPPLVILQAGQINTGAFDPFDALIDLVRERDGWVHVDGAFGLWLAAVPELADRLAGVGRADSWAVDLHKWLNAPFDAGVVVVRDRPSARRVDVRAGLVPAADHRLVGAGGLDARSCHGAPAACPATRSCATSGARGCASWSHGTAGSRGGSRRAWPQEPGLHVLNEVHSNQVAIACGDGPTGTR